MIKNNLLTLENWADRFKQKSLKDDTIFTKKDRYDMSELLEKVKKNTYIFLQPDESTETQFFLSKESPNLKRIAYNLPPNLVDNFAKTFENDTFVINTIYQSKEYNLTELEFISLIQEDIERTNYQYLMPFDEEYIIFIHEKDIDYIRDTINGGQFYYNNKPQEVKNLKHNLYIVFFCFIGSLLLHIFRSY